MPKVYNIKDNEARIHPTGCVFIGRGSPFGNPFVIGKHGPREDVIRQFKEYIDTFPELKNKVKTELKGKDLLCFCAPLACHGDYLLEIANG